VSQAPILLNRSEPAALGPRRLAHLQQRASLAAQCRAFAGL